MRVTTIDHLVLTTGNIDRICTFYEQVLGMETITFGDNRKALHFGGQKINLHEAGREFEPKAAAPTPGAIDLCLLTEDSMEQVTDHLRDHGIAIIEGPIKRTGAMGPILSVYFRDPDGNLIEIGTPNPEP